MKDVLTEQLRERYRNDGYFVLESVIPEAHLALLRSACAKLEEPDAFIALVRFCGGAALSGSQWNTPWSK